MITHNFQDLTGKKFGRLTVLNRAEDKISQSGLKYIQWECQCDCGNTVIVATHYLKKGTTKSCGCYNREKTSERSLKDITNQRFGNLTVIKRVEDYINSNGRRAVCWLCKCDCGNEKIIRGISLRSGLVSSCGCLRRKMGIDRLINYNKKRFSHFS